MIGKLISMLFNFLLGLVATVLQLVCMPVNAIITNLLPDVSNSIMQVTTGVNNLMTSLPWALSVLPATFITTLVVCWGIRLAVSNISISTRTLIKVWNVFQKVKFW